MKRLLRTPDELFQIFDADPALGVLYYTLAGIENLTVQADGTGDGVFKVYLAHRMGQYEAFLWINKTLHKSYVQWIHQADNIDRCRELWGSVVKNRSRPDGSELNHDIDAETIVRIAKQYATTATL